METKKSSKTIETAAQQLWQQIIDFQDLLFDNIHDGDSALLCIEFIKKSTELARFIDKNF